ncbi:MAG: AarF/UbiB family protein [Nanoarchaeota archaeon]
MGYVKDVDRLQEIVAILFEEGLGYYVTKAKLHYHFPFHKRILKLNLPLTDKERQAIAIRKSFERLGPTFIKFGQLLSLRPDLVPKEYSLEFEKLQDRIPAVPYPKVKKIIEEELGQPLTKIFKKFDPKPLATASIAQVHKAVLKSGAVVAVKVQRPNIKKIIDADLDVLFHIAQSLEQHFSHIRNYHPVNVVIEFALWTRKELNFELEAKNALRLKEACKNNKGIKIPRIYSKFSTKKVLTLEFIEGVKLDNLAAIEKYHLNRKKIVQTYFISILEQALLHGVFHADPHPANILVQRNGQLVYLDYGIVGELSLSDRRKVIGFIMSVNEKNTTKSMDLIISLARDISKANLPAFREEAIKVLGDAYNNTIEEKSFAQAFYQVIGIGAKYNVIFDANHVLVAKAVYQAEGLALKLDPEFKVASGLDIFTKDVLQEKLSPTKLIRSLTKTLWTKKELLIELPEHITKIIERLEKPEPPQEVNISQLREIEQEMEYVQRRKNIGLISSVLIIASAILLYKEGRILLWGLPIGVFLFILAIIILGYFMFSSILKRIRFQT